MDEWKKDTAGELILSPVMRFDIQTLGGVAVAVRFELLGAAHCQIILPPVLVAEFAEKLQQAAAEVSPRPI